MLRWLVGGGRRCEAPLVSDVACAAPGLACGCCTPSMRSARPGIFMGRQKTPGHGLHPTLSEARAASSLSRAEMARRRRLQMRSSLGFRRCLHCTRLGTRLQLTQYALSTPRHLHGSTDDAVSWAPPNTLQGTCRDLPVPCCDGSSEETTDAKLPWLQTLPALHQAWQAAAARPVRTLSVSYTHLTLPTLLRV